MRRPSWTVPPIQPLSTPTAPTPQSSVRVTSIVEVKARSTEVLLATIGQNAKPGANILIVGHGNESGLEFRIGGPRSFVYLQTEAL